MSIVCYKRFVISDVIDLFIFILAVKTIMPQGAVIRYGQTVANDSMLQPCGILRYQIGYMYTYIFNLFWLFYSTAKGVEHEGVEPSSKRFIQWPNSQYCKRALYTSAPSYFVSNASIREIYIIHEFSYTVGSV